MHCPDENLALFMDSANFYATARALNIDVDYSRLLEFFSAKGGLQRASYFTVLAQTEQHVAARPLVDFLSYNGWNVTTKTGRAYEGGDGRMRVKGNTDLEMAVEVMKLQPAIAHAVIFTGKADFVPVVEFLQERGTRVTIVSTMRTTPPLVSDDLRRQASAFIDLDQLREAIARPPRNAA